mmetsp:Transcript_14468/g.19818  ORF Transcript_14468/g.19818 Transcript_14468/m.19818 type:complete len:188 (-) Transcript_14468:232-795(-)
MFIIGLTALFFLAQVCSVNSSSTCFCTTVPCPVSGKNYLTEGGGGTGTYTYATHGSYPVVTSASVTITKANLDMGTDTTSCTQDYSRSLDDDGVKDCDAGHILAHRLGGPGNQPINIFPQDLSINRGSYAQFEGVIYDCIKTGGATSAALSWTFSYSSSTQTKPIGVTYKAVFTGGSCGTKTQTFTN